MTFKDLSLNETKKHISLEPALGGLSIMLVDGERIGCAVSPDDVETIRHWLATALEDLEDIFSQEVEK